MVRDPQFSHHAWRNAPVEDGDAGSAPFPLRLANIQRQSILNL